MAGLFKQLTMVLFACAIIVPFASCSGKDTKETKENKQEQVKESYRCPMKCTTEVFSKPGHCPVCNMELEKIDPS